MASNKTSVRTKALAKSPYKKLPVVQKILETDWGFADADTKGLTHEIHRYSGKYIPQVARRAIELVSSPGDLIVDPYVGSGTTLLEANLLKRKSLGIDLNPLAVLISKVKITPIPSEKLRGLLSFFEKIVSNLSSSNSLFGDQLATARMSAAKHDRITDPWYQKWFTQQTLLELSIIDFFITEYKDEDCRDLAKVALSNILRKCSNAHSGYPNVMLDRQKTNKTKPGPLFLRSLSENVKKIENLNEVYDAKVFTKVLAGNAKNLNLDSDFADAIITHPPYIGSVPYAEYGLLSLKWFGYDPKKIDAEITGGKRQSRDVVERFLLDYKLMLREAHRILKSNKFLFILIGDPTVRGEFIDLAEKTKELAQSEGFQVVAEKKRNGVNRRANKMGPETVLFFQKTIR